MATTTRPMTAKELATLPDDGQRYELLAGELKSMSPSKPRHGRVAARFTGPLETYVSAHELGEVFGAETGFKIASDPDTVRAPDAAFVRQERIDEVGDTDDWWPGAPDLAVEVISPDDRYTEVKQKIGAWLDAGCRMVIVIDPRRREVEVYRSRVSMQVLAEGDVIDGGDVVPGWSLPVAQIFSLRRGGGPS